MWYSPFIIAGLALNRIYIVSATPVSFDHGVDPNHKIELSPIPEGAYSNGTKISKNVIIALVVVSTLVSILVAALVVFFRGRPRCCRRDKRNARGVAMPKRSMSTEHAMRNFSPTMPRRQSTMDSGPLSVTSTLTGHDQSVSTNPPPPAYTRQA